MLSSITPPQSSSTDIYINLTSSVSVYSFSIVLIMLFKTQFIKSTLYVILYIVLCSFLFKIRQSLYFERSVFFVKANRTKEKCSMVSRTITNPINMEIEYLERDAMKGEPINLQETTTLLRRMSNVCVKYHLKTPLIRKHFLYDSRHKSMYCWIRKIASTSFTKLFADMKNRPPTQKYYREVDALAPRSLKELRSILNDTNTFKLLIVRHPFQRLVSSYRDRIEDNTKYTAQSWIYVKKIFRITRPKLFRSTDFRRKVFAPDKRLKIIPTFKEFLEWLLRNAEEDDVHWDSYYTHCAVCNVRYSYVLKLDDYTYGQINYIFSKFRLDKTKVYLPALEKTRGGNTDFDTACKYFANLTEDIVSRLYEKYKIDFEMYDYDFRRYLNCIHKNVHQRI